MHLQVPANDHGALYVLELTGAAPAMLDDQAVLRLLGPVVLNTDYVDLVPARAQAAVALPDLVAQGYDLPLSAAQQAELADLQGPVLLIMSRAFGGQALDLALPAGTRLVMVLRAPARLTEKRATLTADSAAGILTGPAAKPRKSDARMSGMVATAALVVMFLLVVIVVWVGG